MILQPFRTCCMRQMNIGAARLRAAASPLPTLLARPFSAVRRLAPSSVVIRAAAAPRTDAPVPSFDSLGLSQDVLLSVKEKGLAEPTEIQAAAVPELLRDRRSDLMIASHTGSGKTLAYLLPIVHMLKEQETMLGVPTKPRRPRALILGPTRELAEQIHAVAKSLAHSAKFRAVLATGAGDMPAQRASLDRPHDMLIATPARVAQHAQRGHLFYGDVEVVVLDEADTMLDRGFGEEVEEILKAVRNKPSPARCVLVSATMTKQVRRLVNENFPGLRTVETSSLHKGVVGAKHVFLPVGPGVDKLDLAVQVVEGDVARGRRVLLFANTLDSCRAAEHHLRERDVPTVCYHGDVPLESRKAAIAQFCDPTADPPPVLVATDLAARGLDVPGKIDHVINFDFPLNAVDYLHRTGRTARAGATGKITSLVTKGDRVLAERVEEALSKGLPLDGVSGDRNVLPPHMRPKPETFAKREEQRRAEKHAAKGSRGAARGSNSSGGGRGKVGEKKWGEKGAAASSSGGGRRGGGRPGGSGGKGKTFAKFK